MYIEFSLGELKTLVAGLNRALGATYGEINALLEDPWDDNTRALEVSVEAVGALLDRLEPLLDA